MRELASALKKKGYLVTFSSDSDQTGAIDKDTDTVIAPVGMDYDHPDRNMSTQRRPIVWTMAYFFACCL